MINLLSLISKKIVNLLLKESKYGGFVIRISNKNR